MTNCTIIGVDTAKSGFALHGADANGHRYFARHARAAGF